MVLSCDMSDLTAVARAANKLYENLPWPRNEEFARRLEEITDEDRAVTFDRPKRGPVLVALASAEVLDLMREYEP